MEFESYLFFAFLFFVFIFSVSKLYLFLSELISCIKILTAKLDRVAASIMQQTDSFDNVKKDIVSKVLCEFKTKDGKLRKSIVKDIINCTKEVIKTKDNDDNNQ